MAAHIANQNTEVLHKSVSAYGILSLYVVTICSGSVTCESGDHFCPNYIDDDQGIPDIPTCKFGHCAAVNPYVDQWANSCKSSTRLSGQHEQPQGVDYEASAARQSDKQTNSFQLEVHNLNESLLRNLEKWQFSREKLLQKFPMDKENENFVRNVPNVVFSKVAPTPLTTEIKLAAFSQEVLGEVLDMHPEITGSEFFLAFVAGSTYHPTSEPLAHRYGGYQFGSWSGQLGDGRALILGEYVNRKGDRWELQLKGSGLTPYSRRGDGRAVIRSSVREFLASEAMHHLGIPTTRAASLVVSNDPVWRDQFYDGHPKKERAAVVLRIAPSWFRIGSLEILAKNGEFQLLRQLTDFIIDVYFPEAAKMEGDDRFLHFYSTVVSSTAKMIAQWMSVGFAHGVMNTDNFSILSLTIDYGPFGFLDEYDPGFVPNTSDDEGMYTMGNQATIGHFNLAKLREALLPLLSSKGEERSREVQAQFAGIYSSHLNGLFREKLALEEDSETSGFLIGLLLKMMEDTASDFTMTFRQLGEISLSDLADQNIPVDLWALRDLQGAEEYSEWARLYQTQFGLDAGKDIERRQRMDAVNPRYILRNWMAQEVIEQVENDQFEGLRRLHRILNNPFMQQEEAEELGYASRPPPWSKNLRVSCSS